MSQLTIEKQVDLELKLNSVNLEPNYAEIRRMRQEINSRKTFTRVKRFVDVVASLLVIALFLSWFYPIIALLIKLESRGPVFFRQKRVGKDGKTFTCLKFRTMIVNPLANSLQARENDSRITRVGHFLRASNLDEFPQFLNVLKGEMTIVGPRPHMHTDCLKFSAVVANYQFRHLMKPGITGLAQIKGYRGPTLDFTSIFHRYQFDAFYVRNASFWLDVRIIRTTAAQTVAIIISKIFPANNITSGSNRRWVMAIRSIRSFLS